MIFSMGKSDFCEKFSNWKSGFCNFECAISKVLPFAYNARSSAFCKLVCGRLMSQRNRKKNFQLRTAPYGRPLVIVVLDEEAEPTQTIKLQFSMKYFIKHSSFGGNKILAS